MLIISKRKDYYDGVVGTVGIDKTIVYNRECEEFNESQIPEVLFRKKGFYNNFSKRETPFHYIGNFSLEKTSKYAGYSYFIVGFCGKLYIGWKFYREERVHNEVNPRLITDITYDVNFAKSQIKNETYKAKLDDCLNYHSTYNALQMFRDLNVPIFVFDADYNRTGITRRYSFGGSSNVKFFVNHNLNDYQFYKVFDSFKAFQELQMFMGGVLGTGEKEIIVVADKYKIAQHGFDKFSFRKDKEAK